MMLLLLTGCWFQEDNNQRCPWTWGIGALTLHPIPVEISGLTTPMKHGVPKDQGKVPNWSLCTPPRGLKPTSSFCPHWGRPSLRGGNPGGLRGILSGDGDGAGI